MENDELIEEYKKDWFSFLSKDEFQAFIFIMVLAIILRGTGFITPLLFEKVFIVSISLAFGDNAITSIFKK